MTHGHGALYVLHIAHCTYLSCTLHGVVQHLVDVLTSLLHEGLCKDPNRPSPSMPNTLQEMLSQVAIGGTWRRVLRVDGRGQQGPRVKQGLQQRQEHRGVLVPGAQARSRALAAVEEEEHSGTGSGPPGATSSTHGPATPVAAETRGGSAAPGPRLAREGAGGCIRGGGMTADGIRLEDAALPASPGRGTSFRSVAGGSVRSAAAWDDDYAGEDEDLAHALLGPAETGGMAGRFAIICWQL